MLSAQPPIDPRYTGKIVGMLYNLSNQNINLKKGDRFLTLEFRVVDGGIGEDDPPPKVEYLHEALERPVVSSLSILRNRLDGMQRRTTAAIQTMLTSITIILAILTLLYTVPLIMKLFDGNPTP